VKRLQFAVPDNVYETLEGLKERTDASSLAEVFRDALRAYAWMVSQFEAGNEVISRAPSNEGRAYSAVPTAVIDHSAPLIRAVRGAGGGAGRFDPYPQKIDNSAELVDAQGNVIAQEARNQ
jgi:hypothetical protein